jgi:hypothetical protein
MQALAPADEIESMICAQAVAAHIAAMQYAGRAMNPEQPLDAIAVFQKGASASSRVFIELLGALDRKRGRGTQQSVRVEHVHIHPGAQGIVGNISTTGGGGGQEMRARLRDPGQLAHAPGACADLATLLGADQAEDLVPVPGDAERPVLPARRRQHGTENS